MYAFNVFVESACGWAVYLCVSMQCVHTYEYNINLSVHTIPPPRQSARD